MKKNSRGKNGWALKLSRGGRPSQKKATASISREEKENTKTGCGRLSERQIGKYFGRAYLEAPVSSKNGLNRKKINYLIEIGRDYPIRARIRV